MRNITLKENKQRSDRKHKMQQQRSGKKNLKFNQETEDVKILIQQQKQSREHTTGNAVSYTHLDVYKRQLLHCHCCCSLPAVKVEMGKPEINNSYII